jgi:tetratricopeptide (TPR) repeat protein
MGRFQTEMRAGGKKALFASPAYAFAGFLHLLLLVALSFWTIAVYVKEEPKTIEVRMVETKKIVPVTRGMDTDQAALDVLMDATDKDLQTLSENDTGDLFNEARGIDSGTVNVFGVGGGGASGIGRGGNRNTAGGASRSSRGSLQGGLDWLVRHRNTRGVWGTMTGRSAMHKEGKRVSAPGNVARTGLALLCFVAAGYGPDHEGKYQKIVVNAQNWLMQRVENSGQLRTGNGTTRTWYRSYEQAIGTLALAECLGVKANTRLEKAVSRAVKFIEKQQSHEKPIRGRRGRSSRPSTGTRPKLGWRYGNGDSDTSVTSWMVLALKSAEHAGVAVAPSAYEGVRGWLAKVSTSAGTTGYTTNRNPNQAMSATGLFLRLTLGEEPTTPMNRAAARLVSRNRLSVAQGSITNLYGIYYSALAMYQVGGRQWRAFNPKIRDALVTAQHKGSGCERGSWRGSGHIGDPVLATTFATLTLETYYRYLPVHKGTGDEDEAPDLEEDDGPVLSPGETQLDVATIAMLDARTESDGGAILAAEAAYSRAFSTLQKEGADWTLTGEAQARLVEIATISKDHPLTLERVNTYMASVPAGETPDPAVVRLRRIERYREAMDAAQDALVKDAEPSKKVRATQKLDDTRRLLTKELNTINDSNHFSECEQLLAQLQDASTRVAFAVDPSQAIDSAMRTYSNAPGKGPISNEERRYLVALLLRAHKRLISAKTQKDSSAFKGALEDLLHYRERKPKARLRKGDYDRLHGLVVRTALAKAAALLALDKVDAAIEEARRFVHRYPNSDLQPQAESIERGALARRVKATAKPEDKKRLAELVAKWSSTQPNLPPAESLALGDLLLTTGNPEGAAKHYARCLTLGAHREIEDGARLGLARVCRARGDSEAALDHLNGIRGKAADRLDVNLERCTILREQGQPKKAVDEYLTILRALHRTDPAQADAWWTVAEETGQAYLESKLVAEARDFLEGVRTQDRTFGGNPKRRARFIAVMRKLDLRR